MRRRTARKAMAPEARYRSGPIAMAMLVAAAAAASMLSGCAPLIIGGAALGGTLVATDRRTSGTQIEDESIEVKAKLHIRDVPDVGSVAFTSYNRTLLITGEVPTERVSRDIQAAVSDIENVRSIVNELAVMPSASIASRSHDALITSKVKASLFEAKDLQAHAFKVVTERDIVYLMGRVTEREAARAAEVASNVGGVQRVVRVVEILSESELASGAPPSKN